MMALLAAFLAQLAVMAPTSASPKQGNIADIFKKVCTLGEAKFAPSAIVPIERRIIPRSIIRYLGDTRNWSSQYFKVKDGVTFAFLIIEERGLIDSPNYERTCSLASKTVEIQDMIEELGPGVMTSLVEVQPALKNVKATAYKSVSNLGYIISAERLGGGYVVLQSKMPSQEERARISRQLDVLGRRAATPTAPPARDEEGDR